MKIEQQNIKGPSTRRLRRFLKKRKSLTALLTSLGLAVVLVISFFLVLGYGAYLKKIGQTTYFKNALLEASKLDFGFVKNYAKGRMAELDDIKIDIKFKHLMRIQYLREQASKEKYIRKAYKDEEFPAKLTFNGKTHEVKMSLTGLVSSSHLGHPTKWSFEVKVKGDDTVHGMKRFGLLIPSTRGHLTDWFGMELMKERGLMGMRVNFVNVTINGKAYGAYYMEERFDKHLIENNRLREGVIFKLDKAFSPYRENKLMAAPDTRAQLLMINRMWQEVMAGKLPPGRFFDLEKLGKVFAICDLMNNKHPLALQNMRFYFNPVTGLAEPITREWEKLHESDPADLSLFLEQPKRATRHSRFKRDTILQLIFDNLEFKRHYLREAAVLSQVEFLDQFLAERKDAIDLMLNKVYLTWPFYELPTDKLYGNQEYMRSVLFPDTYQLSAYYQHQEGDSVLLYIQNRQDFPLEISHLSWQDSTYFYPNTDLVLESRAKALPRTYSFRIPAGMSWSDDLLPELKLHYHLLGVENEVRTVPVQSADHEKRLAAEASPLSGKANYTNFEFIEEKEEGLLVIPEGRWTLTTDLIIPKNKRLVIAAGATINLLNRAGIISYSAIATLGKEENPVVITSSDASGKGLAVVSVGQRSSLSHTVFNQLSSRQKERGSWTGVLAFYESPVKIHSCTFSDNSGGEAFLHITRSEFSVEQSTFKNIYANALQTDQGHGSVAHSSFVDIGGSGIVAGGSTLNVDHVFMNHISASGISAGANSTLNASWVDVRDAAAGITGKDQSAVSLINIQLQNNKVGIALQREDPEFGPATGTADRVKIEQTERPFLIGEHATFTLDGQAIRPNRQAEL